jgi:hypothetical protein
MMQTDVARRLGGFPEDYEIASGEDVDLAFTVWVNSREIVIDERVLVRHVSKGTASAKLDDWQALWKKNRDLFLDKWEDPLGAIPRLDEQPEADLQRNRQAAAGAVFWMRHYFRTRERMQAAQAQSEETAAAAEQQHKEELAKLRDRYDRLRNRRSVALALAVSRWFELPLRWLRGLRRR